MEGWAPEARQSEGGNIGAGPGEGSSKRFSLSCAPARCTHTLQGRASMLRQCWAWSGWLLWAQLADKQCFRLSGAAALGCFLLDLLTCTDMCLRAPRHGCQQIDKCREGKRPGRLYVTDGSMPDYAGQGYPLDAPGWPDCTGWNCLPFLAVHARLQDAGIAALQDAGNVLHSRPRAQHAVFPWTTLWQCPFKAPASPYTSPPCTLQAWPAGWTAPPTRCCPTPCAPAVPPACSTP